MSDAVSSQEDFADVCALADGTLPAERRPEVEARIAASPELSELLARQRRALAATQALSGDAPPASLVQAVEALRARRSRSRSYVPRLALAGAFTAVAVVAAVFALTGGPGGPTVADAARLASKPANGPAPTPVSATRLSADVQGVAFPNFARWAGWRTQGARHGRIDGRDATVVFYGKEGRRLAYVIVAGSRLPRPSGGRVSMVHGVGYQTLRLNGRLAVTWPRAGHTCVLTGDASRAELVRLASWRLTL